LGGRVDTETAARIAGDSALDTRVTTVEGQVNGKIGTLASLTTVDKTTIVAAINEIDAQRDTTAAALATEVSDRAAAVTAALATASADATTKSTNAENTAKTYAAGLVSAEETTARAAESLLTTNLATEASTARAAEVAVANSVSALTSAVNAADAALGGRVDTETAARVSGDAAIRTAINAANATFQAGVAATTHTFAHNLDADFVTFTVLVERAGGKYRNDIVSVEETDRNTLTVHLSESAKVKIAVVTMANL
jgi:hypothetical protein